MEERRQAFRQLGVLNRRFATRLLPERRRPKLALAKQRYREVSQPLRRLLSGSYEQPILAVSGRILVSFQEQQLIG
jgi:hypothetical protein